MSANKDLRWLTAPGLTGPAKRFAAFCLTDVRQQSKTNPEFDRELYNDAAKLIIEKLQSSTSSEDAIKDGQ